jgi:thiol-disulfide isomerase/thioredoxin
LLKSVSIQSFLGCSAHYKFRVILVSIMIRAAHLGLILFFMYSVNLSAEENTKPAPVCQLKIFDQTDQVDLEKFKGQVVYVDFWASWCGPCVESFPFMNNLHNKLKSEGLALLAVNLDEELADAKDFLNAHKADFTVVTDADQQCAKQFAVKAMPSSYLIDRKGMIREVHLGFRPGEAETFEAKVKQLLAETP